MPSTRLALGSGFLPAWMGMAAGKVWVRFVRPHLLKQVVACGLKARRPDSIGYSSRPLVLALFLPKLYGGVPLNKTSTPPQAPQTPLPPHISHKTDTPAPAHYSQSHTPSHIPSNAPYAPLLSAAAPMPPAP